MGNNMSFQPYRPHWALLLISTQLIFLSEAYSQKMAMPSTNSQKADEKLVYVPPSDSVRKSRTAYTQAAHEWDDKRDRTLVKDIGQAPEKIVPRIEAEQDRTSKMLQGRKAYYESLGQYYDSLGDRMATPGLVDPEGQKAVIQQGIMMLVDQRQQLEKDIADGAKEPSIQRQLKEQLKAIEMAKKTLEDDALAMDRIKQGDAAMTTNRASAVQSQKNLAKTMQVIAEGTADLDKLYKAQFTAMKGIAGKSIPDKVPAIPVDPPGPTTPPANAGTPGPTTTPIGPVTGEGRSATPSPPGPVTGAPVEPAGGSAHTVGPITPPPPIVPPAPASAVNLNGNWKFQSTNKPELPGFVLLEIEDTSASLKGKLTITTAPKSWGASQFFCEFSGPRTLKGSPEAAYTFTCSSAGKTGELQIYPQASQPGLIEVLWNSGKANFDLTLLK
ncbi:MAG: hypothetical protein ABI806_00880 [Candidatus Solibacter sp.]